MPGKKLHKIYQLIEDIRNEVPSECLERAKILLFMAEKEMIKDPDYCLSKNLDDLIWSIVFYSRFQELRVSMQTPLLQDKEQKIMLRLKFELDFAACFYQNMLISLAANSDSQASLTLRYKSLIYLGDIARYKATSLNIGWSDALAWYQRAFKLQPKGGRPHGQMALIYSYEKKPFEVLYYTFLSLGNVDPNPTALPNFSTFMLTWTKPELDASFEQSVIEIFGLYLKPDNFSPDTVEATLNLGEIIKKCSKSDIEIISKTVTCLIVFFQDLDNQFTVTFNTQTKQNIRNIQVLIVYILFALSALCMGWIEADLNSSSDNFSGLNTVGVFCLWLSSSYHAISNYSSYGKILKPKAIDAMLLAWAKQFVIVANLATEFADLEDRLAISTSDNDISSLSSFAQIFPVELPSLVRDVNSDHSIAFARIAFLGGFLGEEKTFDTIVIDKAEQKLVVRDEETKRKDIQRMMKALANQRLQYQVDDLEKKLGGFIHLSQPVILPDALCFVHGLHLIKKWLMSKKYVIIISQDVIRGLDVLKKTHSDGALAQKAIRYLDQRLKHPSPFLIAQKPEEESIQESAPRTFQKILGACLFYREKSNERPNGKFFLVTDDDELSKLSRQLGINVMSRSQA